MKFSSKLKNLFKSKDKDKYPKNFYMGFSNLEYFIDYVSENHDFDRNYIYYYQGEAKNLMSLIGSEYSQGEKDIPSMSLEYIGGCTSKNNNIFFEDVIFMPDMVIDLVNRYYFLDNTKPSYCMYRSDTTGFHMISKFVIARDNVYLCSK